jgi:PTS system ascorbate-specific IIA component
VNAVPPLPDEAIDLQVRAVDWRDAVRLVGRGLARSGAARQSYADEMIRMIDEHGPYVVVAPGLALAHARPGPDVLRTGLAVATLAEAVEFGHPHNDPVRVIVGLAVATAREHLAAVAAVANVFNDTSAVDELARATSSTEVRRIIEG